MSIRLVSWLKPRALLISSVILLGGCTQYGTQPPQVKSVVNPTVKQSSWEQRQAYLARRQNWSLGSKISLRYGDENYIFGLSWAQQNASQYTMQITHPLTGALVAKLSRQSGGVTLLADNGRTYRDTDEERLLQNQSGVRIPVKGMQYWVRGMTSPEYKVDQLILDNLGRPETLYQAGWKVSYSNYTNNSTQAMPRRVVLTRSKDKLYIKLIAKTWQGV
ncbi:lipoprotein insertase outer membrane protein LolB [Cocleimonas flava]|uniref:Outer-membrane lipoprotein LolB n=1 Tax=Cocleimonas flava TaxID=634765 RepID=A0A4R1ET86_9GAMM|nr:lipoprotein insertase outer membrane protein LolB [Cocleimonas flava]TCJ84837.1 outer membrane lipoprotein LolB [Cocleimonas flava]